MRLVARPNIALKHEGENVCSSMAWSPMPASVDLGIKKTRVVAPGLAKFSCIADGLDLTKKQSVSL
jgi:hypothetical protein